MSRKKLIIISIVIVVLLTIIAILAFQQKNQKSIVVDKNPAAENQSNDESFTIMNLQTYKNRLSSTSIDAIKDSLYEKVVINSDATTFNGVIRDDSFSVKSTNRYKRTAFIVDIAGKKVSYRVSLEHSKIIQSDSLYVDCVKKSDQIYRGSGCDELTSDSALDDTDNDYIENDGKDSVDDIPEN